MPKKIMSMAQLKKEAKDQEDAEFFIINFIDDTEQELTESQLMDRGYTNIGYAMSKGALFKDD